MILAVIVPGTTLYTDEYDIYARLPEWGYGHKTVCHSRGEYARDEDGDGFHEVPVNTMEGFWSLLRSWLRPHRGLSQEKLPLYLGFFQFVHNARIRGKGLLKPLSSWPSRPKRIMSQWVLHSQDWSTGCDRVQRRQVDAIGTDSDQAPLRAETGYPAEW